MSSYLDLRTVKSPQEVFNRLQDALAEGSRLGSIPVAPAASVQFGHCGTNDKEYYEAHVSWNYMAQCWMMGLSFHGVDNQGRRYADYSLGSCRYSELRMISSYFQVWMQNPRRVGNWIRRHSINKKLANV